MPDASSLRKPMRAAFASAAATAVDVATLLLLVRVAHVTAGVAAALGCLAGGAMNFALGRRWVFAARGRVGRQLALYGVLVVVGGALLAGTLVHLATAELGAPVVAARAGVAAVVFALWTYPVSERVVFRKEPIR